MECDELNNRSPEDIDETNAVHTEAKDPTSIFWRRMKSQESSDSSEKKSESSTELCRISIKCSIPEASSSQDENSKPKSDSESPPIIVEDVASKHSDNESMRSDDYHSQKSLDAILDTSMNKPLSPSSSITSQRKLEWDSLADVGYANESDRKTSASSLSTLERLALKQQYSNNDTKQHSELEPPTAHSTPLEQAETRVKGKRSTAKKTTTIYKKDVDYVEVNVPHGIDENPSQAINVNLTKHISFNVEKDGGITVENVKKDVNITPDKVSVETAVTPKVKIDKEIQTSLNNDNDINSQEAPNQKSSKVHGIPLLITLNTLKRRNKRKKLRTARRKRITKKKTHIDKGNIHVQDRSTEQVSEAESFEYMPGHIYNQNQLQQIESKVNLAGNKSSLESSGLLTTDSSKDSKHSFSKDLKKSIDVLKMALQYRHDDSNLKKQMIKEIVRRLLNSKYRDDDSTTEFLSGLSISSKKKELGESNTTSTSDGTTTRDNTKLSKPNKSILRIHKFNPSKLASTSQSAPNLSEVCNCDKLATSKLVKTFTSSYTESDASSKGKNSSDTAFVKTSSEELYQKYLDALRREETYRRHLRDKENFLKQKLVSSDNAFKTTHQPDMKSNNKLKELIKDLTRNNYDDGSGDASKLEGGSNNNIAGIEKKYNIGKQRSHSVFTLSSGTSDAQNKKTNLKKRLQNEINDTKIAHVKNKEKYCCCRRHITTNVDVIDSSVQVDINLESNKLSSVGNDKEEAISKETEDSCKAIPIPVAQLVSDNNSGDIKYVCLCGNKGITSYNVPDGMLIYKCSRLTHTGTQLEEPVLSNISRNQCPIESSEIKNICISQPSTSKNNYRNNNTVLQDSSIENIPVLKRSSQSSQTNIALNILRQPTSDKNSTSSVSSSEKNASEIKNSGRPVNNNNTVSDSTRCMQTEISINPKISDPSLTDILIINDEHCVEIINENRRRLSKGNSEYVSNQFKHEELETDKKSDKSVKVLSLQRKYSTESNKGICGNIISTVENLSDIEHPKIQSTTNFQNISKFNNHRVLDNPVDNFTIPIQGTNMTLKVSIDSDSKSPKQLNEITDQGTDVIQPIVDEKATCLREECTKGIQSQTTDIFFNMNDGIEESIQKTTRAIFDHNSNKLNNQGISNTFKESGIVSSSYTGERHAYNTYPRNIQINEEKPLLRSATDSGRIERALGIQTEDIDKKDAITQGYPKSNEHKVTDSDTDQPKRCRTTSEESSKQSNSSKQLKDLLNEVVPGLRLANRKSSSEASKDPILDIIQDITRRYSKKDIGKEKRKKCFKEIISVLNYLLDTDDSTNEKEQLHISDSSTPPESEHKQEEPIIERKYSKNTKILIDKAVQLSARKIKELNNLTTESSEIPVSTDLPSTSSDAATCKVLNKIKKECDKYHQKRCKVSHGGAKPCEVSSSTSANCEKCERIHHCSCRGHKCKSHKIRSSTEKVKKKCVAYNLIIQTSDSVVSEEAVDKSNKSLQNIVIKVPPKHKQFKELSTKIGNNLPQYNQYYNPKERSRSLPNECEISSTDEVTKTNQGYTVRDYLEKNRPDFVENCSSRQNCLKFINESRANERATQRQLLSLQLDKEPALTTVSETELHQLAKEFGVELRKKKLAPKFISEKEMKKHSEKIYKSLPEVVRKKEEKKKENIKKTNLLMASIFKKNLQKKTLRGSVNISNYSTVIKI
ncbi:uncharacterized protein LOC131846436 isoform X2 [Achroia grisella]|uniref:uncharacterized protein LOC131846436 isoform X2 n=1 Tax=Achroia grisella TaxID=688607 RepID=UPI0027D2133F|nr:uncharacterized protein LOC131846436 isoform X2 [Achroia grisella]